MTNKEYNEKKNSIETYNGRDYLNRFEVSALAKDVRNRNGFQLKGFNNRATVKQDGNVYTLTSYYTNVCSYNTDTKEFKKLWDGYSSTTLKHVNTFCDYFNITGYSKREWIELETR